MIRRLFQLCAVDAEFLNSRYEVWETITEGENRWVLIAGFCVPKGYDHSCVSVALRLQPSYPDVQIDMAYFCPGLARADGKQVNNLSSLQLDEKTWQQWSRHRVGEDAWRPGVDNIETHLLYITAFLEGELQK